MTCGCAVDASGRQIVAACELHETWAREREHRQMQYGSAPPVVLDAYGPPVMGGTGKSTAR